MSTTILGESVSMPIGVAPSAFQRLAHPDGEVAAVRAAEEANAIYCMSTVATASIEEVGEAAPKAVKWFQLYLQKDRQVMIIYHFVLL